MLADCLRVPGTQRLHHVAPQDQTPTQASGPAAFAALPGMNLQETHVVMSHEVLYMRMPVVVPSSSSSSSPPVIAIAMTIVVRK